MNLPRRSISPAPRLRGEGWGEGPLLGHGKQMLEAGARLGSYEIVASIGAGGMGEVYRAKDLKLGRDVAIKILREDLALDPERLRRFEQEAHAASSLNHPNIVTIHNIGEHEGTRYIAMEYVEGKTLREMLGGEPLPNKKLLQLSTQIADGLAKAHSAGIVHRDLKPENLMVTNDGFVKILDFGIAKLTPQLYEASSEESSSSRVGGTLAKEGTTPGVVMGTVGYMSPEQAKGLPSDYRSDQFALGTVLYEMAAGKRAFRHDTQGETQVAIIRDEPEALTQLNPNLPAPFRWIVERCLAKAPEERYTSTQDLARELQNVRDHLDEVSSSTVVAKPQLGHRRAGILSLAALPIIVLALVVGLNVGDLRERLFGGATPGRIESIAVLPLENLSGDPEQEYFADGMTEALIADLAKVGSIKVISRTSVMQYKGVKKPLPEIARELGVDAVVEGSVMRSGDRVRITAQLIDAATDQHLWTESYERDLRDILALQSEVARAIAKEIKITLTPQEEALLASARPVDPEAHEAYLRGRYSWNKEDVKTAVDYFERAIDQDPDYAIAYAGLADAYAILGLWGITPPAEAIPKARAAVQKALELDDTLAEAHTPLGLIKFYFDWEWSAAQAEFRRALELNPSYALAHDFYAVYLAAVGRLDEALAEIKRAKELDPLSLRMDVALAFQFRLSRQYDRSIEEAQKVLEMDPSYWLAQLNLATTYRAKGLDEEIVLEAYRKQHVLAGDSERVEAVDRGYAESGPRGAYLEVAEMLVARSKLRYVSSIDTALAYVYCERKDEAFFWLEKAYAEGNPFLALLAVETDWDPIRSDPRFQDLVRRMNFPD